MNKETVITTNSLNSYGCRVLTTGIDLTQYRRNPILLWMHRRSHYGDHLPVGRVENLRFDGDRLIGTPVFDMEDEFACKIAGKWEKGFLRMVSAGLEVVETSVSPEHLLPGQTRATITRSKLIEVSIVDIGANDDALQLYDAGGRLMQLSAGMESDLLPLLTENQLADMASANDKTNQKQKHQNNQNHMNKELLTLLGLPDTATGQEVTHAVRLLKTQADEAERLRLSAITTIVDGAIADRRLSADKKDHFVDLGKKAGIESLQITLASLSPVRKPTELIHPSSDPASGGEKTCTRLSDVPASELSSLKEKNPAEYARLYRAEYGIEL